MTDTFRKHPRELSDAEKAHIQAVRAIADQMLGVLKGDRPDPRCMLKAIEKLEECVQWAEKAITIGAHL